MLADRARTCILITCVAVFLWNVVSFWPVTIDDAFIVFRYARHLAAGHGPNFNVGADTSEGVTQVFWMWLMAVPEWLGIDTPTAAKVLGVLATAVLLRVLCAPVGTATPAGSRLAALGAAGFIATVPATAVHSVSGMETSLYTLHVTLHLLLCRRLVASASQRGANLLAVSGLMLGLQRPDGNVIAAVSIVTVLLLSRDRYLLRTTLLFYVLPGAVYFVGRWWYYGYPLPLPVYVKMLLPPELDSPDLAGTNQALEFIHIWGLYLAVPLVLGLTRLDRGWLPAAGAVLAFVGVCLTPAHIMGFEWRYFFPVLPALAVLCGLGVAQLYRLLTWARTPAPLAASLAAAVALAPTVVSLTERPRRLAEHLRYARGLAAAHVPLGRRLAAMPGAPPRLAIADAGAVPYYSGWPTIDSFGLNEPAIATTGRHDPGWILQKDPGLVVLISKHADRFEPALPWEQRLHDAGLDAGYGCVRRLTFSSTYHLWLFARPGTPVHRWLLEWRGR